MGQLKTIDIQEWVSREYETEFHGGEFLVMRYRKGKNEVRIYDLLAGILLPQKYQIN